jgi:thiol-disulfide isomerase/thioredoxin
MKLIFITLISTLFLFTQNEEIKVVDYEGLKPYLNKQNDTTYIINFWATWCGPCVKELPYFEKITENYKDQKLKVILVSLDFPKSYQKSLVPFVKRKALKSEVILLNDPDSNNWISKIDKNWSGAIPATIIYNKNSRSFYEKSFTYEELEAALKEKLVKDL